jgi:hypothetical protein
VGEHGELGGGEGEGEGEGLGGCVEGWGPLSRDGDGENKKETAPLGRGSGEKERATRPG